VIKKRILGGPTTTQMKSTEELQITETTLKREGKSTKIEWKVVERGGEKAGGVDGERATEWEGDSNITLRERNFWFS